jgi:hypothetical protein
MDYLRSNPVILVFVALGVLLVSTVLVETFRKPRMAPTPPQEHAHTSTRFTNAADLAIILLALVLIAGIAARILN